MFVPFDYELPEEQSNPNFRYEVLGLRLSGILNWALVGCYQYQEQGLNPPECIVKTTNDYCRENDRIGRFIEERLVEDIGSRVALKNVKNNYLLWATANGFKEVSTDRVSQELRQKGYSVEKRNNGVFHALGLRLKTNDELLENCNLYI